MSYIQEEQLCDYGASMLLMPEGIFERYTHLHLRRLAQVFMVSEVVAAVRCVGMVFRSSDSYHSFNRRAFMEQNEHVVAWVLSCHKIQCRKYTHIFGVSDILSPVECPTLFTLANQRHNRLFWIPYLIIGYWVPPEMEDPKTKMFVEIRHNDGKEI